MSDLMVYIPYIPQIYKLKKACKYFKFSWTFHSSESVINY